MARMIFVENEYYLFLATIKHKIEQPKAVLSCPPSKSFSNRAADQSKQSQARAG